MKQTSENSISQQKATVTQTGVNTAKVTQETGKLQSNSAVDPVGDPATFNHTATVTQGGGSGNDATVKQIAEEYIWGSGQNFTTANQNGENNTVIQTQISGSNTSGGMVFNSTQVGERNRSEQFSKKTNGLFDIYQNGERHEAYQRTTGENTGNLWGDIQQTGERNKAWQKFHGQNVRNAGAEIIQSNERNEATQEFDLGTDGAFYNPNSPSAAKIVQTGQNNDAYQKQVGQGSYQELTQNGDQNDANMRSYGNYNEAYAIQSGTSAELKVVQKQDEEGLALIGENSKGNSVKISQAGNNSEADIMQDGFSNVVTGLSGSGFALNNNGAFLKVRQTGVDNQVWSRQLVGASETVTQTGANNTAIVNQY